MIKNITNLGDSALYCDFGENVSKDVNLEVINYFNNIKASNILGITNITPSYNKLIISFDLNLINFDRLKEIISDIDIKSLNKKFYKVVEVPVCCDDEFLLDINRLESKINITKKDLFNIFFSKEYYCYMTGFIAGMPFMGDIDEKIRAKRLETPRVKVPKGSIGITEQFCNIYTFESPGGWNIIGNTPLDVFDKLNSESPTLINPGDKVKFYKITKKEYIKIYDKRKF